MDHLPVDSLDEVIRQALTFERRSDGWNPQVILTDSLRLFRRSPGWLASRDRLIAASAPIVPTFELTPELVDRIAERMIQAVRDGQSPETALSVLTQIHRPEVCAAAEHAVIHSAGLSEQALQEALFVLAQYDRVDLSAQAVDALTALAISGVGGNQVFAQHLLEVVREVDH